MIGRWFPKLILAAMVCVAATGIAFWIYRIDLVTWALARLLEREGFGSASFTVDKIDLQELRAHDVTLRDGAIKAQELTVSFSPLELLSSHLGQVEIAGFALSLAVTKQGLEMNGEPLAMAGGGSSAGGGLRIDALILRDAHLLLATAAGPIEATISTVLTPSAGEIGSSAFNATITAPLGGSRRRASVAIQKFGIELPATGGVQFTLEGASVTMDGLPWTVQAAGGHIAWQSDKTTAELAVGQLINRQKPVLVTPLSLNILATLAGNQLDFSLQAKSIAKQVLTMRAKGRYDIAAQSGAADIAIAPVGFRRGSLQPADLFPAFGNPVADVDGSLAIAGSLRLKGTDLLPDLVLKLDHLAFTTSAAEVQDLKGEIRITRLWPLATAAGQSLTATIVTAALAPTRLSLKGQLDPKPALKLDRLAFSFAGGEITAAPFTIDPLAPAIGTTLQVDGVDLAEITKLLSLDGLSGTGQLDGPIPFLLKNSKIEIKGGHLTARKPGVLNYRPSKLPDALASAGGSVELALQALSDFHYEKFALSLDKSATGEGTVLLQLEGQNPAVMSGQVFHFNIRVDSNFDRLADIALESLRSAQELLRRATRRATP